MIGFSNIHLFLYNLIWILAFLYKPINYCVIFTISGVIIAVHMYKRGGSIVGGLLAVSLTLAEAK